MSALFLIFMDQFLAMIGASAETWDYVKTYLTIVSCSGPFVLIANCYSKLAVFSRPKLAVHSRR